MSHDHHMMAAAESTTAGHNHGDMSTSMDGSTTAHHCGMHDGMGGMSMQVFKCSICNFMVKLYNINLNLFADVFRCWLRSCGALQRMGHSKCRCHGRILHWYFPNGHSVRRH